MVREFDELNQLQRSTPYEKYFGEMELTEEEKKKRIAIAEDLEIIFLYFFLLYQENPDGNYESMIAEKYIEVAKEYLEFAETPAYISDHAEEFSKNLVRATMEHDEEEYYISQDRAMVNSENEANVIGNYGQQVQAVKSGKKYKTWITMADDRVRHTHNEVDRTMIGIFDLFHVGDSVMSYPKDTTYNPEEKEVIGCRCTVHYS